MLDKNNLEQSHKLQLHKIILWQCDYYYVDKNQQIIIIFEILIILNYENF